MTIDRSFLRVRRDGTLEGRTSEVLAPATAWSPLAGASSDAKT
jgi:hypothetical protein